MNERRYIRLCQDLNRELGRKDRWRIAIQRFRRWVERARERWILDEPLPGQAR